MDQLISSLTNAGLISGSAIMLDQRQCVDIVDFKSLFGSADGSYEQLCTADNNEDGTTKGYKRFFDTWHAAGIF